MQLFHPMQFHPKFLIPNSFTALSMVFGLASIVCAATGNCTLAAWMILWGTLLDKLDGAAARLFHATSSFGVEFDSFADFVVFGIAPAALCYFRLTDIVHNQTWLIAGCGFYTVASAVRLARFNVCDDSGRVFYGIPTTVCGGFMGALYLTWESQGLSSALLILWPALMAGAALSMISNIRLPKIKSRNSRALNLFQAATMLSAYILAPLRLLPEYLLGLVCFYVITGVFWAWRHPNTFGLEDADEIEVPAV